MSALHTSYIKLRACCAAAFTSVSAAVRQTLRENGFRGPFQGLTATIIRNTPANSVYLGSFEVRPALIPH